MKISISLGARSVKINYLYHPGKGLRLWKGHRLCLADWGNSDSLSLGRFHKQFRCNYNV